MTYRDRLIELMSHKQQYGIATEEPPEALYTIENHQVADYLLSNNVIVPPCKVGDTLWVVWSLTKSSKKYVFPVRVYALRYDDKKNNIRVCANGEFKIESYNGYYTHYYRGTFPQENVGKTVFLTKEEAEAELRKRGKDNEC